MIRELRRCGLSRREIGSRYAETPATVKGHSPRYRMSPASFFAPRAEVGGRAAGIEFPVFTRALDAIPMGLCLFSGSGQLVYTNRLLMDWLARDEEAEELFAEMHREVARLLPVLRGGLSTPAEELSSRELSVEGRAYRIRSSAVDLPPLTVGTALLVSVEDRQPEPPSEAALQERFGLSPQESRVALRLARGRTNRQIAKEFFISEHTARHHTQRVLSKVGAQSRAEVVARILDPVR
jgi:DNA-binding CsgD family transcriptional regulator